MPTNPDLAMPEGLSAEGIAAHAAIIAALPDGDRTYTGGCQAFYSPAEWKDRNETYGTESELIVVYDGGNLPPYFALDYGMPRYTCTEKMRKALEAVGLYAEECTNWYSAVYKGGR